MKNIEKIANFSKSADIEKTIKEVQKATDSNDFYGGWEAINNNIYHNPKFAQVFKDIESLYHFIGHASNGVKAIRDEIEQQAKSALKQKVNATDYADLMRSF